MDALRPLARDDHNKGLLQEAVAGQFGVLGHPTLARSTPFVTDAELAKFMATYVKLGDLAKRMRTSGRALRPRLSAAGIEPAFAYDDVGLFL